MKKISWLAALVLGFVLTGSVSAHAGATSGYDKGFFIADENGNFQLKTNFQFQLQHQYVDVNAQGKLNTVQIRRGRINLGGHAFTKDLTYKVQFEFKSGRVTTATAGDAGSGPRVQDSYINYAFMPGLQLMAGQFRPQFNFEQESSSVKLQFVDRGLINEVFSLGRDLGLSLQGKLAEEKFWYGVFAVNEGGNFNITNRNNHWAFGGRATYALLGQNSFDQSDVNNSENPNWSVGAGVNYNKVARSAIPNNALIGANAFTNFKWHGFSAIAEGVMMRNHTTKTNTYGLLGQAGMFVVPKKFELAARVAAIYPGGATNGYEVGGVAGYFFKGDNLKLQVDYNALINSALVLNATNAPVNVMSTGGAPGFNQGQTDHRVRTQLTLYL